MRFNPTCPAPSTTRAALGQWGESQVRDWCLAQGFTILAAHVTAPDSEIDLITQHGDRIAFCEVRVRRTLTGPTALESIGYRKQQKLRLGADRWMASLKEIPPDWHFHFDVYLLERGRDGVWELERIEDAF